MFVRLFYDISHEVAQSPFFNRYFILDNNLVKSGWISWQTTIPWYWLNIVFMSKHARETIQIHRIPSKFPLPTHLTNLLSVNILSICWFLTASVGTSGFPLGNCLFPRMAYFGASRRRQWHPSPVLLPGKSHGWRSLVGCSPWGREELDMTEWLHFHFSLSCIGEGNGNPLQCPCLENPRDGGAWWAAVYEVTQSQTRLEWLSSSRSDGCSVESDANVRSPQRQHKSSPRVHVGHLINHVF